MLFLPFLIFFCAIVWGQQDAANDVFEIFRKAALKPVPVVNERERVQDLPVIQQWREQHRLPKLVDAVSTPTPPTPPVLQQQQQPPRPIDDPFVHKACDIKCSVALESWLSLPLHAPKRSRFVLEVQLSVTRQGERVPIELLRQLVQLRVSAHHVESVDDAEHGALFHADLRLRSSELNEILLEPLPHGALWHIRVAIDLQTSSIALAVANRTHVISPHSGGSSDWHFVTRHAVPLLLRGSADDPLMFWFRVSGDDDDSVVRICVRDASCTEWIDSIDSVAVAGRGGRVGNRFL
jgi:hypothetical protein